MISAQEEFGPRRSLSAQAIMLAASSAAAQILVAVLYIATARGADPTDYGHIVTSIALGTVAIGFFDFGSSSLWVRERASGRMDSVSLSSRARSKASIAIVAAGAALVCTLVWAPMLAPTCAIFFAGAIFQMMQVPMRALRRGELAALTGLVERLAAVAIFGALLSLGVNSLNGLWISLSSGTIVAAGVALILSRQLGELRGSRGFVNPWGGAQYYGLSAIAGSAQQLDLPILTAVAGPGAAGIFGGVNRWTQPMGMLASAVSSASTPFIAHASDWKTTSRLITRAFWLLLLAITACIMLAVLAPWLVEFLLGAEYAGSAPVLQWLAVGTIPAILNQPLAAALQARHYDHLVAWIFLSAVVVQLGLVAMLGLSFGGLGAALAYFVLQSLLLMSLSACVVYAIRREV